jgi:hypothetical protein
MTSQGVVKAMAVLALAQGVLGLLRSLQWFQFGGDLSRTAGFFVPLLSMAAFARGGFVVLIAALYVLFAWGAFTGKGWAWGIGVLACVVNAVAVVGLLLLGESLAAALVWAVVPVILSVYLLGAGRRSFAPVPDATLTINRGV